MSARPIEANNIMVLVDDELWWYANSRYHKDVEGKQTIRVRVLDRVCEMAHVPPGTSGKPIHAFRFVDPDDRKLWQSHRRQRVALSLEGDLPLNSPEGQPGVVRPPAKPRAKAKPRRKSSLPQSGKSQSAKKATGQSRVAPVPGGFIIRQKIAGCRRAGKTIKGQRILCIAGSLADNRPAGSGNEQWDCLMWVCRRADGSLDPRSLRLHPIVLCHSNPRCNTSNDGTYLDPYGRSLGIILNDARKSLRHDGIVTALNMPICGAKRLHSSQGQTNVASRTCDQSLLRHYMKAGLPKTWRPGFTSNEVVRASDLIESLRYPYDHTVFPKVSQNNVVEYDAMEAMWAINQSGLSDQKSIDLLLEFMTQYPASSTAAWDAMKSVLEAAGQISGVPTANWRTIVTKALQLFTASGKWPCGKFSKAISRHAEMLTECMLGLATCQAFLNSKAHVWIDDANPTNGHIMGPGI